MIPLQCRVFFDVTSSDPFTDLIGKLHNTAQDSSVAVKRISCQYPLCVAVLSRSSVDADIFWIAHGFRGRYLGRKDGQSLSKCSRTLCRAASIRTPMIWSSTDLCSSVCISLPTSFRM